MSLFLRYGSTIGSLLSVVVLGACSAPPVSGGAGANSGDEEQKASSSKNDEDDEDDDKESKTSGTSSTSLTLASVQPSTVKAGSAPSGMTVTLTGTNFANGVQVSIDGSLVTATVASATTLTVLVPGDKLATAGTVKLAVVGASSSSTRSNEVSLVVTAGDGVLTSITPSSAALGSGPITLTVMGNGFDQTSTVVFNNANLTTTFVSTTTLRATVPRNLLSFQGQIGVGVRQAAVLSTTLPFTIGSNNVGNFGCSISCAELGLFVGQCVDLGGNGAGFGIDFGGFGFGFGGGGNLAQCWSDGCVYQGCE